MRTPIRLGALGAAAVLVLAGCGDAGEDDKADGDAAPKYEVVDNAADSLSGRAQDIAEAGTIKIGVKFDQPGIGEKKAGADAPEGFDVELGKIIAGQLGIAAGDIEWVEAISANREPFLKEGTVDLVIASYSITDDRRKVVGQAGPYYLTGQQLLVKKGSDIESVADVTGKEVCSVTGSTSLAQVEAKGAKPVGFEKYTQCRDQVLDGSVAAMTTDGAILLGYAAQYPDELEVVGDAFSTERYGVGYAKDAAGMCDFLNDALTEADDSGSWEEAFEFTLGKSGVDTPDFPALDPCP